MTITFDNAVCRFLDIHVCLHSLTSNEYYISITTTNEKLTTSLRRKTDKVTTEDTKVLAPLYNMLSKSNTKTIICVSNFFCIVTIVMVSTVQNE